MASREVMHPGMSRLLTRHGTGSGCGQNEMEQDYGHRTDHHR